MKREVGQKIENEEYVDSRRGAERDVLKLLEGGKEMMMGEGGGIVKTRKLR